MLVHRGFTLTVSLGSGHYLLRQDEIVERLQNRRHVVLVERVKQRSE